MLDLTYFQNRNSNVQGFFNGGTWQTWTKPRGAKMVNIICVGSGAGGGGGFQSASTPRGGGGGGGGGAIARLTVNASLLPDTLYILPGRGGDGGLGGTTATAGSLSQNTFICLLPDTTSTANVLLRSGTTRAIGGGAGTTSTGAGGAGETVSVAGNNIFANLGTFTFQAGSAGTQGGTGLGVNQTPVNPIIGGCGGGGTGTGGTYLTSGVFPAVPNAPVTVNGRDGIVIYKPIFLVYGGTGGGGSNAAGQNGGNGGNGAPGCGGGGGGSSSNTGVNAGNGGRGGDGFVIITTSL